MKFTAPGEILSSCTSTNEVAREKGLLGVQCSPHGTWVSSLTQTQGRGRLGRSWASERGNLFLSIILRPSGSQYWTWVPLLGAVGVLELLVSGEFGNFDSSRFSVKWPNDLWIDGKKFGGVLCEVGSSRVSDRFLVLGLGLNCAVAPKGIDPAAGSLDDCSLAERLRAPLAHWIAAHSLRLDREGPGFLMEAYHRWALFRAGDFVSWKTETNFFEGIVRGIGADAELEVILSDGSIRSLYSEDVSKLQRHGPSFNRR